MTAIYCKALRDITALKTARRTQREGALEMVLETLHYQMIMGNTIWTIALAAYYKWDHLHTSWSHRQSDARMLTERRTTMICSNIL